MEDSTEKKERKKVTINRLFETTFKQMLQNNDKINKSRVLPITLDNSESQTPDKTHNQHEQSSTTGTASTKRSPEATLNDRSFKNLGEQGFDARQNFDRHVSGTVDKHSSYVKRSSSYSNNSLHNGPFHRQNSNPGQDFDYYADKSNNIKRESKSHLREQGFNTRQTFDRHAYGTVDKQNSNFKQPSSYPINSMRNGQFYRQSSNSGKDFDYYNGKSNNIKPESKSYLNKPDSQSAYSKEHSDSHNNKFYKNNPNYQNASRRYSDNDDNRPHDQNKPFRPYSNSHNKTYNNTDKQGSYRRQSSDYHTDKLYKNTEKQISDSSEYSEFHSDKLNTHSFWLRTHSENNYDDSFNHPSMHDSKVQGHLNKDGPSDYHIDKSHKNTEKRISDVSEYSEFHSDKLNRHSFRLRTHSENNYDDPDVHDRKSHGHLNKDSQKSRHNSDILSKKLYRNHEDQVFHSHAAGKELDNAANSQSAICLDSGKQGEDLIASDVLSTDNVEDEESENVIEYSGNTNQCTYSDSETGFKICLKNDLVESTDTGVPLCSNDISSTSLFNTVSISLPDATSTTVASDSNISLQECSNDSLPPCSTSYSSLDESSCNAFEKICKLIPSSEDDFIPPPIMSTTVSEENKRSFPDREVQSSNVSTSSESDESCFSLPSSEHLKAISNFIIKVTEMKTVKSAVAINVERDLNLLFKDHLEGNIIEVYGSYDFDLAITTSDINFVIKAEVSLRKSFMFEVYKVLKNELSDYHILPYEEGTSVHQSKINFSHPTTGVGCQLAYLGRYQENVFKMGKFLKRVCARDRRARTLILAAKIWAEHLRINEVEEGKLHPIGFVLLVIHFLQHCENPILPIYQFTNNTKSEQVLEDLLPNKSSVGELWLSFLRYYSVTFNWQQDVVTVNSKESISKKSKQWDNYWIAIEDPYSGKNVAEKVVNCDVADHIKACFKSSFEHFMSPPVPTSPADDNEESPELEFSFDQCVADQTDSFCEMCDEIDDVCEDCKKKYYVQPMATLPKMTDSFLKKIKEALSIVYEKYMLSDKDIRERKNFVSKLQEEVNKVYPEAQLNLFGSSTNGFGFQKSDLDICMTFKNQQAMNSSVVLRDLRRLIRKDKNFENVFAVFDAKIPILKFRYKPKGWLCDISLNNTLAVHNSELLYTYSLIDKRCKILGCALKLLAKKALIAEVTEKALSSYSYLIMVIHFLQQTEPPVLPVLQDSKYRRENYDLSDIVDRWNVWFCKDLDYIKEVFKSENDTPVEQLFLELLDYYCSFDCNFLISIRQKEIKPLGEKHRAARLFNIQDPFIETKNLGCVVSASKAQETKSVFNRARCLFRTPITELPSVVKDIEDFFFSSMSLTGRIQKEAHCELCNKFGHEQKDCSHSSFFQYQKNFFNRPFKYHNSYAKKSAIYRKPIRGQPIRKK